MGHLYCLEIQGVSKCIYSVISELPFWKVLEVEPQQVTEIPCLGPCCSYFLNLQLLILLYLPKRQKEIRNQAPVTLFYSISWDFFAPMSFVVGVKGNTQIILHYVQSNDKS